MIKQAFKLLFYSSANLVSNFKIPDFFKLLEEVIRFIQILLLSPILYFEFYIYF